MLPSGDGAGTSVWVALDVGNIQPATYRQVNGAEMGSFYGNEGSLLLGVMQWMYRKERDSSPLRYMSAATALRLEVARKSATS
jgi:hypothetical protein